MLKHEDERAVALSIIPTANTSGNAIEDLYYFRIQVFQWIWDVQ